MEYLFTSDSIISFFILVVLEIILGIDNVIFVSIILNRLPSALQKKGRIIWMFTGIAVRCGLLIILSWLLTQKGKSIFTVFDKGFDISSLVMIFGGLFLLYKTVREIHHKLDGEEEEHEDSKKSKLTLEKAVFQIILIDMVFSFDSVITAGGTAKHLEIMIAAVVIAMIIMFLFSARIAAFIHKHPTIKMLALSFLVLIGFILIVEGWNSDVSENMHLKNYAYFAMAFSFLVELMNLKMRKNKQFIELNEPISEEEKKDLLD